MRFARRDVRGRIKYSKTDCRRSYRFYRPGGGWNRATSGFFDIVQHPFARNLAPHGGP